MLLLFRVVAVKTGECVVPSQPFLEWLCLKVLGAMKLLNCTMSRCSTAFLYPSRNRLSVFLDPGCVGHVVSWSFLSPGPQTLQATHEVRGVYHPKHGADQHGQPSVVSEPPLLLPLRSPSAPQSHQVSPRPARPLTAFLPPPGWFSVASCPACVPCMNISWCFWRKWPAVSPCRTSERPSCQNV